MNPSRRTLLKAGLPSRVVIYGAELPRTDSGYWDWSTVDQLARKAAIEWRDSSFARHIKAISCQEKSSMTSSSPSST